MLNHFTLWAALLLLHLRWLLYLLLAGRLGSIRLLSGRALPAPTPTFRSLGCSMSCGAGHSLPACALRPAELVAAGSTPYLCSLCLLAAS